MRRWLTIVGILGVVFHADLIVRHNAVMVSAKLEHGALVSALAVICHGTGASIDKTDSSEIPFVPAPSQAGQCPDCGTLCGFAITPVPDQVLAEMRVSEPSVLISRQAIRIAEATAGRRPPPTGPPSLI